MMEGWPVIKSNNLDGDSFGMEQGSEMILSFFGLPSIPSSVHIAIMVTSLSSLLVILRNIWVVKLLKNISGEWCQFQGQQKSVVFFFLYILVSRLVGEGEG